MKITIEHDDKKVEVFQDVTDAFLAVRQATKVGRKDGLAILPETRSYSWGGNIRELLKEIRQAVVELQTINDNRRIQE